MLSRPGTIICTRQYCRTSTRRRRSTNKFRLRRTKRTFKLWTKSSSIKSWRKSLVLDDQTRSHYSRKAWRWTVLKGHKQHFFMNQKSSKKIINFFFSSLIKLKSKQICVVISYDFINRYMQLVHMIHESLKLFWFTSLSCFWWRLFVIMTLELVCFLFV